MKNRTALQNYCLEAMGITRWVDRTKLNSLVTCLIMIDLQEKEGFSELSSDKQQLLERMLQALKWPHNAMKIIFIAHQQVALEEYTQKYQPQKMLLFNIPNTLETQDIQVAVLPSLGDLLSSPAAKKQAWKVMQPLVGMCGISA